MAKQPTLHLREISWDWKLRELAEGP